MYSTKYSPYKSNIKSELRRIASPQPVAGAKSVGYHHNYAGTTTIGPQVALEMPFIVQTIPRSIVHTPPCPAHQPCFFNSMTLFTAALNPVLNRALQRWLLNRFFLRPLRSWNFCEWNLFLIFWSRHIFSSTRRATMGVGAEVGDRRSCMKTVRPETALARTFGMSMGLEALRL